MFIRESKTTNRKTGKVYVKHVLVESVRTERGPRQRNVMTLGSLELPRELWKPLAQALEDYLYGSQGLEAISNYELPEELIEEIQRQQSIIREKRAIEARKKAQADEAENAEETDSPLLAVSSEKPPEEPQGDQKRQLEVVDTSTLSFSESRTLGPELLAHQAWMQLEFEQHLKSCGFSNREIALAAAVIWGRLISPGSDLSTWRWLRNESSLNEFFPANISRVHKDKIYEIPDKLLAHKDKLEDKLYARQRRLFPGRKSVHLFDLTNFYFEGKCEKNKLAKRGKSKEKRSQNALVSLALIVDQDGFPVKSKVYTGNVSEPETLEQILKECGLLNDDLIKPVLIMDRGIATKENVSFIKEKLFPYAVIQRADHCKEYKSHFEDLESFTKIEDSKGQTVYVKNVDGKTLCCSDARRSKEEAIQNKKKERALADLELLNTALEKGTLKDPAKIYERLGRIRERHAGIDKLFKITTKEIEQPQNKKHPVTLRISFTEKKQKDKPQNAFCGCYVIESHGLGNDPKHIWSTYMTLTRVEGAFRSMKTDLGTRPVYHQGAERTEAHLFISILAYHILANIEYRLRQAGDPREWRTLCATLKTHQRATLTWRDEHGEMKSRRCSGDAELHHREVYNTLNVKDPLPTVIQ